MSNGDRTPKVFPQIAAFHFAGDYAAPLDVLQEHLSVTDTNGSLLILPEAFNCGRLYRSGKGYRYSPESIITGLEAVATARNITFIVSLLCPDAVGEIRNTAYLVSMKGHNPICMKALDDGTRNYKPCQGDCDIENPIQAGGTSIGVLICMDVDDHFEVQANCSGNRGIRGQTEGDLRSGGDVQFELLWRRAPWKFHSASISASDRRAHGVCQFRSERIRELHNERRRRSCPSSTYRSAGPESDRAVTACSTIQRSKLLTVL